MLEDIPGRILEGIFGTISEWIPKGISIEIHGGTCKRILGGSSKRFLEKKSAKEFLPGSLGGFLGYFLNSQLLDTRYEKFKKMLNPAKKFRNCHSSERKQMVRTEFPILIFRKTFKRFSFYLIRKKKLKLPQV